ncbi:hypothetical protein Q3G72_023101 [Acer saccharum]|nr:hypothetical protein Q3G72_023101 [Acer saccharum]
MANKKWQNRCRFKFNHIPKKLNEVVGGVGVGCGESERAVLGLLLVAVRVEGGEVDAGIALEGGEEGGDGGDDVDGTDGVAGDSTKEGSGDGTISLSLFLFLSLSFSACSRYLFGYHFEDHFIVFSSKLCVSNLKKSIAPSTQRLLFGFTIFIVILFVSKS